jgi:CO/xanthine dehydrogenase Mo-binding subunit
VTSAPFLEVILAHAVPGQQQLAGKLIVSRAFPNDLGGKIINMVGRRGQINGGIAQGIGYALLEGQNYQDGRPTTHNLHEYKIPTVLDMPP